MHLRVHERSQHEADAGRRNISYLREKREAQQRVLKETVTA
jgi:hypothetical protein